MYKVNSVGKFEMDLFPSRLKCTLIKLAVTLSLVIVINSGLANASSNALIDWTA